MAVASIAEGISRVVTIPARRTLRVTTAGQADVFEGTRTKHVDSHGFELSANSHYPRSVTIKAATGPTDYTIFYSDVVPFTGSFTLAADDEGKVFRCDDPSNVTVTVPATLPECFSAAFVMGDAGTVTIAAGSGATKRSSTATLNSQYQWGSLFVGKNANDASAEFVLGGDFA
jgi:hypothetical protein